MDRSSGTLPPHAGIALAPILMIIALLAVITGAFAMGSNMFGANAINTDRIILEVRGQSDMIRAKIEECVMVTRRAAQSGEPQFLFPGDDTRGTPIDVVNLDCPRDPTGQQNLWAGARPATLPAPPRGFNPWVYVNHGDPDDPAVEGEGGICITIKPNANLAGSPVTRDAIKKALSRYSRGEVEYRADDPAQRIIFWLRHPRNGNTC